MNVVIYYPRPAAGGCERRIGDLGRWLLDNGDEAWLVCAGVTSDLAYTILCGQCGFPYHRILQMPAGGTVEQWVVDQCREVKADILDVQWCHGIPDELPCAAVYTTHGLTQPYPERHDFAGHIPVDKLPPHHGGRRFAPVWETVYNWANLRRFPYQEKLGEGACFVGRSFKMGNVRRVAARWSGIVDAYGISAGNMEDLPANVNWLGFSDPAQVIYGYRVVFASAQSALEGMAAGRLVIAGHEQGGYNSEARLLTPANVEGLASRQFWHTGRSEAPGPDDEALWRDFAVAMQCDFARERRQLRAYVEREHDMDKQCRKIRRIYERCLQV